MKIDTIIQNGHERVIMDRDDYENLIDALDHARAMRDVAAGAPTLTEDEAKAYLACPTPLAFWRKRAGKTQAALAAEVGISQPFLAQIEQARRDGTVGIWARLAKALDVRMEDLVVE